MDVRGGVDAEAQGQPIQDENKDNHGCVDRHVMTGLVTGLVDSVVLGEVVPRMCRLPWNQRPPLRTLNQSWNKAMTERFPIYHQRLHNPPNILSNALILSHMKQTLAPDKESSYRLVSLWVCRPSDNNGHICEGAITIRLPEHPIVEVKKYNFAKFVCDNHRVFSFTPSVVTVTEDPKVRQNIYNVWMLDLTDFNVHWKRLPPLPRLGNCVYASSSLSGDKSSYIWQRKRSGYSEADGWKLSAVRSGEDQNMNSLKCKWHWEHINVNTRPPKNLNFDLMSERLPLYVEIEQRYDRERRVVVKKELYRRCPIPEYTLTKTTDNRSYGVMISGSISEFYLFDIMFERGGICIFKIGPHEEMARTVEEQEWDDFVRYWNDSMRGQGAYEMPHKWHVDSQEKSAMKILIQVHLWRYRQDLKLTEKVKREVVNKHSTMRLAQKGPIYLYSYLGTRFERLRL